MPARKRKHSSHQSIKTRFVAMKSRMTGRRLTVAIAGCCLLLATVGVALWYGSSGTDADITADQLDRDFEEIGLSALGVSESARLPRPDASTDSGDNSTGAPWMSPASTEVDLALAESPAANEGDPSHVIFPEAIVQAGPLFPNPLSAPGAELSGGIQRTEFTVPAGAKPEASGPAWLTGGIEFADE